VAERAVALKASENLGEPLSTVEDEPAVWLVLHLGERDERLDDTAEEYFGGLERRMHNLGGLDTPEAKRNAERYTRMLVSVCPPRRTATESCKATREWAKWSLADDSPRIMR
jgi:hypothetical protein